MAKAIVRETTEFSAVRRMSPGRRRAQSRYLIFDWRGTLKCYDLRNPAVCLIVQSFHNALCDGASSIPGPDAFVTRARYRESSAPLSPSDGSISLALCSISIETSVSVTDPKEWGRFRTASVGCGEPSKDGRACRCKSPGPGAQLYRRWYCPPRGSQR